MTKWKIERHDEDGFPIWEVIQAPEAEIEARIASGEFAGAWKVTEEER